MKSYTVLFAGAAAATEYAYSQSFPAKAYATITPGGTYAPVTVTSQYQTIPTYVSDASSYSSYLFVSTVITDGEGKPCTVTKTDEPVTVSHYISTITHTSTGFGYTAPTGSAAPYGSNATASAKPYTKTWTEKYERICEIPYKQLGPSAIPGYPGSGLCGKDCSGQGETKYQPQKIREFKNGKWNTYNAINTYGAPTPKPTTFANPGTYTIPEYDQTVKQSYTAPAQGTYHAPAGKTVTYGGSSTYVTKPTTITASYGAYETKGSEVKTIYKTVTITADQPNKYYTIAKPTITKYDRETTCHFPTNKVYPPGVYHHSKETVTITKSNQAYTCSYEKTSTYSASTPTPTYSVGKDTYPTAKVSSKEPHPTGPVSDKDGYPTASSSAQDGYSTASSTPVNSYPTESVSKDSYPTASSTIQEAYPTASTTKPHVADPSSDYYEPIEEYGTPSAGYVKRGGMLKRRSATKKAVPAAKHVILI